MAAELYGVFQADVASAKRRALFPSRECYFLKVRITSWLADSKFLPGPTERLGGDSTEGDWLTQMKAISN